MKERAEDVGGRFHLTTMLGGGTRIETIVPRVA
jgi:signal transduction histidine kinase